MTPSELVAGASLPTEAEIRHEMEAEMKHEMKAEKKRLLEQFAKVSGGVRGSEGD